MSRTLVPTYISVSYTHLEAGPVVTGDAAMLNENNNYASKMSSANPNLKVTIPPVSDIKDVYKRQV